MSFGTRMKQRREELGLKQKDLGAILGVSGAAIGNYENGVSTPKAEVLNKVFDALQCDANFLFQDEMQVLENDHVSEHEKTLIKNYRVLDEHGKKMVDVVVNEEYERCMRYKELKEIKQRYRTIPYSLYPASAGYGEWIDDNSYDDLDIPNIPEYTLADYAVRVHGDSMIPEYEDGDIVLIHNQDALRDGDIGLFWVEGEGGLIKEYRKGSLYPHNKAYNAITLRGKDFRCFGKVIAKLEKE